MLSIFRSRAITPAYTPLPPLETYTQKSADLHTWAAGSMLNSGVIGRNRDFRPGDDGAALASIVIEDVYACLQARLQALDGLHWEIRQLQSNSPQDDDPPLATREDVLPAHPLALALRWFRLQYKFSLFHIWYYSKLVTGKAFIQPLRNITGSYSGLEWYNPTAVYIEAPQGVITYFRYYGRGKSLNFKPDQLIYDYYPNLVDEVEGQSPVEVMLDSLNIERNMRRALNAYFRNGMRIGAIISPDHEKARFSQTEIDAIIREMKEENIGVENTFKNLMLPYGVDVVYPPQQRYEHLDSVEDRITTKIHKALRVPAAITGDMAETRYKENRDMYDAWVALTILPDAREMRDIVNFHLIPKFDPTGRSYFVFDESEWSGRVTQAALDKLEEAGILLDKGAITLAQYNERVGVDMTPEERAELDVRFINPSALIVRRGQLSQAVPNPAIPPEDNATVLTSEMDAQAAPALPATAGLDINKEGTQSACILLKLANNPDMLQLRQRVAEHVGDVPVEWNDPDTYHVTLAYAPAVTDEQLETLKALLDEVTLPDLDLNIGSLNAFDDMGRHAVHFRIRRNTPLLKLHQRIVDLCMDAGVDLSTYSQPDNYIPHITMGYASSKPGSVTYHSKISVRADALQLTGEDQSVLWELSHAEDEPAQQDDALEELKAWRRFASKPQKRVFEVQHLRGDVEHYVKTALAEGKLDHAVIFSKAEWRLGCTKAIQATRLDFEDTIGEVVKEARAGRLTRRRFGTILRDVIRRYGRMAYIDGLVDGGVTGAELDEEDERAIAKLTRDQSTFVTAFGSVLYKEGGITDAEAQQKPLLWWNKSVLPFYNDGVLSANRNQMLEFAGKDGKESCLTCIWLKGQRHRAKQWKINGLRPGEDTHNYACGGWRCEHILVPTTERARGKFPTPQQIAAWLAAKSIEPHEHQDQAINFEEQPYTQAQYAMYYATKGYTDMLVEDIAAA